MAKKTVFLSRKGKIIRVRIGRYVEAFDSTHMTPYEVIDRVRWICITGDASFSELTVQELLRED